MNGQKRRICSDCGGSKVLNGYVFYRLKTFSKKKIFDDVCIECRKKDHSYEQNLKRRKLDGVPDVCKNRNCSNKILRVGFKTYCSSECRVEENMLVKKEERKDIKKIARKEINIKYLVRGRISGVDYD